MKYDLTLACGLMAVACGDRTISVVSAESSGSPESSGDDVNATDEFSSVTSTQGTTSTVDDDASTGSSTGSPAMCGDGVVEGSEECDDDSSSCRSDCLRACRVSSSAPVVDPNGQPVALHALDVGRDGIAVAVGWSGGSPFGNAVALARVAPDGTLVDFARHEGASGLAIGAAVVALEDGGAYVAGTVGPEVIVLRFDRTGAFDLVETPVATDVGSSEARGAIRTTEGDLLVSGSVAIGSGDSDAFVAHYAGQSVSAVDVYSSLTSLGTSNDRGGPLAMDAAGAVYVAGMQSSELGGVGIHDPVVIAFDAEGSHPLWSQWLEASNLDLFPAQIAVDGQGRIAALYMLGHGSPGSTHFLLVVLEPDGALAHRLDSEDLDFEGGETARGLVVDETGGLYVLGTRIGAPAEVDASGFVVGIDPSGAVVCEETMPQSLASPFAASAGPDGEIVVVTMDGEFNSQIVHIRGL